MCTCTFSNSSAIQSLLHLPLDLPSNQTLPTMRRNNIVETTNCEKKIKIDLLGIFLSWLKNIFQFLSLLSIPCFSIIKQNYLLLCIFLLLYSIAKISEDKFIVSKRGRYLHQLQQYRNEGRPIFFMDETYCKCIQ